MNTTITYVADLSQDVDDVIAATYLMRKGLLGHLVADPEPTDELGLSRLELLRQAGVDVCENVPKDTQIAFVGGALTKLARFLRHDELQAVVINGGFVGADVVDDEDALPKFRGRRTVRTYNFNLDVQATHEVLMTNAAHHVTLVGKNVCHSPRNTYAGIWHDETWLECFDVPPRKRLHDLLMVHEGLVFHGIVDEAPYCETEVVHPYNDGLEGDMTKWGSSKEMTTYPSVLAATKWADTGKEVYCD